MNHESGGLKKKTVKDYFDFLSKSMITKEKSPSFVLYQDIKNSENSGVVAHACNHRYLRD
jgi:hypothetical protein